MFNALIAWFINKFKEWERKKRLDYAMNLCKKYKKNLDQNSSKNSKQRPLSSGNKQDKG